MSDPNPRRDPVGTEPAVALSRGLSRLGWLLLAWAALILGLIGIVVPGLPTTPFVLLAAYAAARSSTRLHGRLMQHRQFGPMIRDWQREGAVSRRAKWLASVMMMACAALLFWAAPRPWMAWLPCAVMAVVLIWLWRRPSPSRAPPQRSVD